MAKRNPHRRKKQPPKPKEPKDFSEEPFLEQEVGEVFEEEPTQEKGKLGILLVLGSIILAAGLLFWAVSSSGDDPLPSSSSTAGTGSSTSRGIPLGSGGNLGQLDQQGNTGGIQDSNSPSSNSSNNNAGSQSSALQPTIDKCTYQRYTGQSQSPECVGQ